MAVGSPDPDSTQWVPSTFSWSESSTYTKEGPPRLILTPPCLRPPLQGLRCPKRFPKRPIHLRPHLDILMFPPPTQGLLHQWHQQCLHPFNITRHTIICWHTTHPSHYSFSPPMQFHHLCYPPLYDAKKSRQGRIHQTWINSPPLRICGGSHS